MQIGKSGKWQYKLVNPAKNAVKIGKFGKTQQLQ